MSKLPAIIEATALPATSGSFEQDLLSAFLASQTAATRDAYSRDLRLFAGFRGETDAGVALERLIGMSPGEANGVMLSFRTSMIAAGLTSSTANRRLSAIRAAVKLARMLGRTTWVPEVGSLKVQSYRDTTGPGLDGTRSMLNAARIQRPAAAKRDAAIIRLFFDLGLRRGEVVALDVPDVDVANRKVWFIGKGKTQKESRTLPPKTLQALVEWIAARSKIVGQDQPALFVSLQRRCHGQRITGRGVHYLISSLGNDVGISTRPHGLRHASITTALDQNGGDVRAAQQHARHANPQTTMKYDDNRKDLAGRIAAGLADVL